MDQPEYLRRADTCLEQVARWLEDFDPDDVDYSTADGMVTLHFADGTRFVVNRQSAARQIWVAAGARAWHYGWDGAREAWLDDRDGHELFANLAAVVAAKLGREAQA